MEPTNETWEGELKHLLFTLCRAKDHYEEVIRKRDFIDLPTRMAAKALDKAHQDIRNFISEERKRAQIEMLKDMKKHMKEWHGSGDLMVEEYAQSLGLSIKE